MSVVIVGPTASGKSDVAMHVARSESVLGTRVSILAVDAMQVYKDMTIGTGKPTAHDREVVQHYGIDLVESHERYTVSQYKSVATKCMEQVRSSGERLIVVAGTGLYLTALIDDLDLPGEFPEVRVRLQRESDTATLYARLCDVDPKGASRIERSNRRRIIRALEVSIGSSRPFSSYGPGAGAYPENGVVQIGIRWPRELLAIRIAERVHKMMDAGFLQEVRNLRQSPRGLSITASQALGYKELSHYLDGKLSLDQAVADTITHTRQFAVRQERWFRRDPRIKWVDIVADPVAEVGPTVELHL